MRRKVFAADNGDAAVRDRYVRPCKNRRCGFAGALERDYLRTDAPVRCREDFLLRKFLIPPCGKGIEEGKRIDPDFTALRLEVDHE